MTSAAARLSGFGQSAWYDNLTREVATGGIDALIPILVGAVVVGAFLRVMLGRTGALLAGAGAGGAGWLLVGLPMLLAGGLGVVVAILVLAMGAGGRGLGPIVTGGSPKCGGSRQHSRVVACLVVAFGSPRPTPAGSAIAA